jgi:predicted DNA-binding ribbon-helix-helix protein
LTVTDNKVSFLSPSRQKVLQVDRRRYSVRLEEAYWQILEDLASYQNVKLSHLVDDIAHEVKGESGLAAALRLRCLRSITGDDREGGAIQKGSDPSSAYATSLENLLWANPAPSLLLAEDGRILLANQSFQVWSGINAEGLIGQPYEWYFQLRLTAPREEIVENLVRGGKTHERVRISYIAPGRVIVANGRVCLGQYSGPKDYTWIVMIEITQDKG